MGVNVEQEEVTDNDLLTNIEMIRCTETGASTLEDHYRCEFFGDSDVDSRGDRPGVTASVKSIHLSDVEIERHNDRRHSITRGQGNGDVVYAFDEEVGCMVHTGNMNMQCQPEADAREQYAAAAERLEGAFSYSR